MLPFDLALRNFWHGIFEGKKYPIAFYTKKERMALAREVAAAAKKYSDAGRMENASGLLRSFEFIGAYISAKNLSPGQKILSRGVFQKFLKLLYGGKTPDAFWIYFRKKYLLPARQSPAEFWSNFEEFQPKRLDVAAWLKKHANGKTLDIGAGAHSYIMVDCAIDSSAKALAKNRNAKRKIVFDMNKKARLPFATNSFGTIMLNSSLAYCSKPRKLLAECRRLLVPGGTLLITNAPVNDYHPAKYFQKKEISAPLLADWLGAEKLDFKNESQSGIILLKCGKSF